MFTTQELNVSTRTVSAQSEEHVCVPSTVHLYMWCHYKWPEGYRRDCQRLQQKRDGSRVDVPDQMERKCSVKSRRWPVVVFYNIAVINDRISWRNFIMRFANSLQPDHKNKADSWWYKVTCVDGEKLIHMNLISSSEPLRERFMILQHIFWKPLKHYTSSK